MRHLVRLHSSKSVSIKEFRSRLPGGQEGDDSSVDESQPERDVDLALVRELVLSQRECIKVENREYFYVKKNLRMLHLKRFYIKRY